MTQNIEIHTEKGVRVLSPCCLMVGLDETGHEQYADVRFPVFGLGGCAILAKEYERVVQSPWNSLKREHFPDSLHLHAADLRSLSENQVQVLTAFFVYGSFFRFAALTTIDTAIPPTIHSVHVVVRQVLDYIARIATKTEADSIALIVEDSSRLHPAVASFVEGYHIEQTGAGVIQKFPFEKYRASKNVREPLLEAADFIIHTAGCEVRARREGRAPGSRQDFQAMFMKVDRALVHFIEITGVELSKPMG